MAEKTGRKQKFGEKTVNRTIRIPFTKTKEIIDRIENEVLIDYTTEEYKQKKLVK